MQKTIQLIVLAMLCTFFNVNAQLKQLLKGKVITSLDEKPIPHATVKISPENKTLITNEDGEFTFNLPSGKYNLLINYVGYKIKNLTVEIPSNKELLIKLEAENQTLQEVEIVSTGYQKIAKERATGSFVLIDSNLLNRITSTNILDRLNGVTSGLIFNKNVNKGSNFSNITIRGRSTLFANPNPLIILDNFPYEGDIGNINPNDIESITILKDAAAASIWGTRAGNGVIVLTSRKGRNGSPTVNFQINSTLSQSPNLQYKPQLNSEQYIDVQHFLFNKGFYNSKISNGYNIVSPAVEIFINGGNQSKSDSIRMINNLKEIDVRDEIKKYFNRIGISQQYQIGITGGSEKHQYYLSGGYDKNLYNSVTDNYKRFTLNAYNSYTLFKDRLKWNTNLLLSNSENRLNNDTFISPYPYAKIIDENGNHLSVERDLRSSFVNSQENQNLLDWNYRPLDENRSNNLTDNTDYRLSTELNYKILNGLNLSYNFLYQKDLNINEQNFTKDSYYARNLINSLSEIETATGEIIRPIPIGGIVDKEIFRSILKDSRFQINYDSEIFKNHDVNVIAGIETSDNKGYSDNFRFYGFDSSSATNGNASINFTKDYPQFYGYGSYRIPTGNSTLNTIERNRSYFINAAYTFKKTYTASFSARWDESNIFGVKTNQKGVPLWSTGMLWNISNESFYKSNLLPVLKLKASIGYNGNRDKSVTALLTSQNFGGRNTYNNPYLVIINPPNPSLRWEKIRIANIGIDFALSGNILTGSFEYFNKRSEDLISNMVVPPQSGFMMYRGNAGNMNTTGWDFKLNANVNTKVINWNSSILLSHAKSIITSYKVKQENNLQIVQNNYQNPLEGYPYDALFSFPWAGLDENGKPLSYIDGIKTNKYSDILFSTEPNKLIYNGPSSPILFGSIRNSFSYKNIELSVLLTFKLGYHFRRSSINYRSLYAGNYQQADFDNRWQKPGDEKFTNVPVMSYPANAASDLFYSNSTVLVEKADHMRFQDLRLGYTLSKESFPHSAFKTISIFSSLQNIGLIWRANKFKIDPDYPNAIPTPITVAFGLKSTF